MPFLCKVSANICKCLEISLYICKGNNAKTKNNNMNRLTTINGKKNKTWLKNRILNGTIKVQEQNEKRMNESHLYYDVPKENILRILSGMFIWESSNNEIVGSYGTSYYYRFFLVG